jgi:hypothetical protein
LRRFIVEPEGPPLLPGAHLGREQARVAQHAIEAGVPPAFGVLLRTTRNRRPPLFRSHRARCLGRHRSRRQEKQRGHGGRCE